MNPNLRIEIEMVGPRQRVEAPPVAPAPARDVAKFAVSVFLCRCSDRSRIFSAQCRWERGAHTWPGPWAETEEENFTPPELIICCGNCRPQSLMKLFHFPGLASVIFSAGATLESQDFKQWKDGSVYNHKEGLGLVWSRLIKAEYKGGYLNFYWLLELIGV